MSPERLRVLVAQNGVLSTMALKTQLEAMGHEVVGPAFDGRQAAEMASRESIDLAILESQLPRLAGVHLAVEITRVRAVPVILVTEGSDRAEFEQAAAGPVHQILVQPFPPQALAAAIVMAKVRFLENRKLRAEIGELEKRLDERKIIERAKGILMDTRGLSERDAYRLLQRESQNRNQRMVDIARTIVTAESLLRERPNSV